MTKNILSVEFKMDTVSDAGEFTGYASTFGNVDLGGDIVAPGAFKKSIKETKGKVPILDHHNPRLQIGWNMDALEDNRGLLVKGKLNLEVQGGREKHALMKQAFEIGAMMGLSIGYRTIIDESDRKDPRVRILKEVQLLEYSVVTFPMNPQASVTGVKSESKDLEEPLKRLLNNIKNAV